MGTTKTKTIFYASKILLAQIKNFQHKYQFPSRSSAIVWLITWALKQKPVPPPQNDDYYE